MHISRFINRMNESETVKACFTRCLSLCLSLSLCVYIFRQHKFVQEIESQITHIIQSGYIYRTINFARCDSNVFSFRWLAEYSSAKRKEAVAEKKYISLPYNRVMRYISFSLLFSCSSIPDESENARIIAHTVC